MRVPKVSTVSASNFLRSTTTRKSSRQDNKYEIERSSSRGVFATHRAISASSFIYNIPKQKGSFTPSITYRETHS